jgi:hypothetical protein
MDSLAEQFHLTEADRAELLASKRQSRFKNRVYWALVHLRRAGLIESTGRGLNRITERGHEILRQSPSKIDLKLLSQFPEFRAFRGSKPTESSQEALPAEIPTSPQERITSRPSRSSLITPSMPSSPVLRVTAAAGEVTKRVIESLTGMTSTTKRWIAREWLIFLVCILIGLSVTYFAIYFPVQYVGQHFVEVTDAETKDFLNDQYTAEGIIPHGYRRTNSFFNPPDGVTKNAKTMEESNDILNDRRYYTYDWEHVESFYRRKNPAELFSDLGEGHLWLWFFVLSPCFLTLLFVRSVIWSVRKVVTK